MTSMTMTATRRWLRDDDGNNNKEAATGAMVVAVAATAMTATRRRRHITLLGYLVVYISSHLIDLVDMAWSILFLVCLLLTCPHTILPTLLGLVT